MLLSRLIGNIGIEHVVYGGMKQFRETRQTWPYICDWFFAKAESGVIVFTSGMLNKE